MKVYPENHQYYPNDKMIIQKSTKNLIFNISIDNTGATFKVPLQDILEFLNNRKKE
jgi:hypothetical protein